MSERSIFLAALDFTDPSQRSDYLNQACDGNGELRRHIDELIQAEAKLGGFLARPHLALEMTFDSKPITERPGTVIGPYKLLQQIGEGGMGVVYMAEQSNPIKRRVALKIIKPGMDTREVVARFEAERQALALMDHPNIAKVFDGGATESGRPYFVMELVKGIPLTQFCDENRLDMRQRLELFSAVCKAIQHAHNKGIIHRDIKPSNVMVTLHDGEPVPKVIDFGVSKAVTQQLTEKTMFTAYGQMIGTPAYMSPEQAEMSGLDIDTRSDIYSLGVLLYELLTGSTPLEATSLRGKAYAELQRMIREEEAEKPSLRLSTRGEATASVASQRNSDPKRLGAVLRGELDWIVLKTLEKNRDRRYETANGLAADIGRYLRGEAILARPPSVAYKLRKFAGRNKAVVVSGLLIMTTLLACTAVSTWQAVRANRAQRAALVAAEREMQAKEASEKREAETNAVLEFMENQVFKATRPESLDGLGQGATLRRVVEEALPNVNTSFNDQPLIAARLHMLLGSTLAYEKANELAVGQFELARALFTQHLGPDDPATANCMYKLASGYSQLGRNADAIKLQEETLAIRKRRLGNDHPDTVQSMIAIATSYSYNGRRTEGLKLQEEAIASLKAKFGPNHPKTMQASQVRAFWLLRLNRHDEAIQILEELIGIEPKEYSSDDLPIGFSKIGLMSSLARAYETANRKEEALRISEDVVLRSTKELGEDHVLTFSVRKTLSNFYARLGRYQDAFDLSEKNLTLAKAKYGANIQKTAVYKCDMAERLFQLDRAVEAASIVDEVLQGPDGSKWNRTLLPAMMSYYARTKDVNGCRQTLAKLDELDRKSADDLYTAAYFRAILSTVLKSIPSPDSVRLADEEAERAVVLLRQAIASGYDDAAHMDQDHDLDVLRERPDFQAMMIEFRSRLAGSQTQ